MKIEKLCVFCGSSDGTLPLFSQTARELADEMVRRNMGLVYGGGSRGLMGIVARGVLEGGLPVTGISPRRFHKVDADHLASEYLLVDTMHERKEQMYRRADAFLAIPGGIGTLEEIAEILTWNIIGFSGKPAALLNAGGFFDPFLAQLDTMAACGFLREDQRSQLITDSTVPAILDALEKADRTPAPWSFID